MSRDWRLALADIVEYAADAATAFVGGMTREEFDSDLRTLLAVRRALAIIGEAVRNVPEDVRARAPEVAWPRVVGSATASRTATGRSTPKWYGSP